MALDIRSLPVSPTPSATTTSLGGVNDARIGRAKSYTVANLPSPPIVFGAGSHIALATDGRKASEGAGNGTGVLVFWNPSNNDWVNSHDSQPVEA